MLVSSDDAYFHRLARDELLVGELAGNLRNERFVEENDSWSGGDGVF
jgi:hypothetical protein